MDDDDFRRGQPSAHRKFGVRRATLAAVAMVPLATRVACDSALTLGLSPGDAAAVTAALLRAAGAAGMIAGQVLDLEGEGRALQQADLEAIHAAKTGSLIAAAAAMGAMAAGAETAKVNALAAYGRLVGLAFQISDDLLDITGSTASLGKTAGRDAALRKSTYVSLLGAENARAVASQKVNEAVACLREVGLQTPLLTAIASWVIHRRS
jgi:geranylgeranyl pyrophosphate synthase